MYTHQGANVMTMPDANNNQTHLEISDQDIYEAMEKIPGYLDITPGDFKELYRLVYSQAIERIRGAVIASDIMTREVVTVFPEMSVEEAANIMAASQVSGVVVVDSSQVVQGMLSERDFLVRMGGSQRKTFMDVVARCLGAQQCAAIAIREKNVVDIMSSPAIMVQEDRSMLEIATLLKQKQINRVPVVDSHKKLLGIVSRQNIVHTSLVPGI